MPMRFLLSSQKVLIASVRILHLDCLSLLCLSLFLKFCSALSFGTCLSPLLGCILVFVSVLNKAAVSLKLGRVVLCSRGFVGSSNTASPITQVGPTMCTLPLLWGCATILLYLILNCCWHVNEKDLFPSKSGAKTGCDHRPTDSNYCRISCVGYHTKEQDLLQWGWYMLGLPLECGWVVVLRRGLKTTTGYAGSETAERYRLRTASACDVLGTTQYEL